MMDSPCPPHDLCSMVWSCVCCVVRVSCALLSCLIIFRRYQVVKVTCETYDGQKVPSETLIAAPLSIGNPNHYLPSKRYMEIIREGAYGYPNITVLTYMIRCLTTLFACEVCTHAPMTIHVCAPARTMRHACRTAAHRLPCRHAYMPHRMPYKLTWCMHGACSCAGAKQLGVDPAYQAMLDMHPYFDMGETWRLSLGRSIMNITALTLAAPLFPPMLLTSTLNRCGTVLLHRCLCICACVCTMPMRTRPRVCRWSAKTRTQTKASAACRHQQAGRKGGPHAHTLTAKGEQDVTHCVCVCARSIRQWWTGQKPHADITPGAEAIKG